MGRGLEDVRDEAALFPFRLRGESGRRARRPRRPRVHAARDFGLHPARAEAARRGVLPGAGRVRLRGGPRGHHRAGLLQRRAADGHARRRPHRRPRGAADHQRADRRVAGLRPRPAEDGHDRRLRLRRRHLRHLDPPRRGRRLPGARDQRRHAPRAATTSTSCSSRSCSGEMGVAGERVARAAPGDPPGGHPGEVGPVRTARRPRSAWPGPAAPRRGVDVFRRRMSRDEFERDHPARSSSGRSSRAAWRSPTPA